MCNIFGQFSLRGMGGDEGGSIWQESYVRVRWSSSREDIREHGALRNISFSLCGDFAGSRLTLASSRNAHSLLMTITVVLGLGERGDFGLQAKILHPFIASDIFFFSWYVLSPPHFLPLWSIVVRETITRHDLSPFDGTPPPLGIA